MAEDIEEIRRQKLAELQNRAETGGAEESDPESLSEPIHINGDAELSETVAEHDLVLADFYADWCGPCQMLEPVVETIAADTGATVTKIDIDANQQLAAEYGVRGFRRSSCSLTDNRQNDLSECRTKLSFAP